MGYIALVLVQYDRLARAILLSASNRLDDKSIDFVLEIAAPPISVLFIVSMGV
jgi:hypothetical protein